MKIINAANLNYRVLNETLRGTDDDCIIEGCCGQRFIAAGMSDKIITVNGIPGNALGAYLNNANYYRKIKCSGRSRRHYE